VHQRLPARQHPRSHLDTFGTQYNRRRRGPRVAHAGCGDYRQVDAFGDERQQDHRRRTQGRLESAALDALDHQGIDPGVGGFGRRPK
jgi:hypothetical protein